MSLLENLPKEVKKEEFSEFLEKSLKKNIAIYKERYIPIAEIAESKGVKIAFENCPGRGTFVDGATLAVTPVVWEFVFRKDPENIGMNSIIHELSQIPVKQMLGE